MARSVEDIFNSMVGEKQSLANLGGLMPLYNLNIPPPDNPFRKMLDEINSGSIVSPWRLFLWLVASAQHTLEVLWDSMVSEMNSIAASAAVGNTAWYAAQVLLWQNGYSLLWNSNTYRYYYSDTTSPDAVASRIAAKVSVNEVVNSNFDGVLIKVAKSIGGVLAPLDNTLGSELTSLTTFVGRIKFAGIETSVISLAPDDLLLNLDIYYDGTLDLVDFQTTFNAAIQAFITSIPFDGVLHINDLIDAIRAIPGSKDPGAVINYVQAKADSDIVYTSVIESYNPASGYFVLDPGSVFNFNAL